MLHLECELNHYCCTSCCTECNVCGHFQVYCFMKGRKWQVLSPPVVASAEP